MMIRLSFYSALLSGLIFGSFTTYAYEVDNFTDRDLIARDSLEVMNRKVNRILSKAATEVLKEDAAVCSKAKLRQEILRWIRPDPTGQIEVWLEITKEVDRAKVGLRKSIYQDVGFFTAPVLNLVGLGRSIKLAGQIVGSDKIGHFFMQGLEFFDLVQSGNSIENVLKKHHGEDGVWGLTTSGVFSYSDIAADYSGYLFWNELTQGKNPYYKCDEKKGWVLNREFNWAEYVNPAWDEAINCSSMRPKIQAKVDSYLEKHGMKCPMIDGACKKVLALDHSEYFISPKCKESAMTDVESRKGSKIE
jgi:hypothetical protein